MPHQNQDSKYCIVRIFKDGGEIVYRMFWIHDEYATGDIAISIQLLVLDILSTASIYMYLIDN